MSDHLEQVRKAAARKRAASLAYTVAVSEARAAGLSAAKIADVAGVSRQAVLKMKRPDGWCKHPPSRLMAWVAGDGVQCVCCSDCGKVLAGSV